MSELHKPQGEHHESHTDNAEARKRAAEVLNEARNEAAKAEHHHAQKLEEIRKSVEEQAESTDARRQNEVEDRSEPEAANTYWYSREYRELAFKQLLQRTRKHMNRREKVASKVVHQPTIERISEIGEKTVARTSGVLMGSIFSFLASIIVYFFARRNGYDMTYAIFGASFIGGFSVGVTVEFAYRGIKSLLGRP